MPDWYHVSVESAMETLTTEIRLFASRISSLRSILLHFALLAAFGIWIPQMKGVDFLDSQILGAYACLGLLFAGPATAQAFPESIPSSFKQAIARIFAGVLYGEIVSLALTGAGIATVYLTHRGMFIPQPDWPTLAKCALFGLAASGMLASLAALAAARFSRRMAMVCLRVCFFGLLVLYYYRGQFLTDVGLAAAAACIVIAGLFIELLRRAYR
jgi:hypothetical protein